MSISRGILNFDSARYLSVIPRLFSSTACEAVKIRELKVPSTYILDINDPDPPPIHMDCMYDVQPDESGFVLKWLLEGSPVYQWIPPKKPQAIAFFKTRADPTFEMDGGDPLDRFRSLNIIRPAYNMTGEFTCSVQTFQSSDKRSARLQIIGKRLIHGPLSNLPS